MSGPEVERVLEEKRTWIEAERRAQVPRLSLERRAVSESEARVAARELVSALAERRRSGSASMQSPPALSFQSASESAARRTRPPRICKPTQSRRTAAFAEP
jgi:hypothetical protein